MNTLLITALFASMVGSNEISAQADTIEKYIVDGKMVYGFEEKKDRTIVRTHVIKTSEGMLDYDDASVANGKAHVSLRYSPTQEKPLVIVDDKEYKGSMESIDPETIKTITVLKDKAATDLYGEKAKDGVVVIETKKK